MSVYIMSTNIENVLEAGNPQNVRYDNGWTSCQLLGKNNYNYISPV